MSAPPRRVSTELPGPRAKELMAQGTFDMQSIYRAVVFDDAKSQGCSLVDVDGNVFLDMFSSFALGAVGYNHPRLLEVARSEAFAHASINPSSTPFVTAPSWFEFVSAMETHYGPKGMARIFCVDAGGEGVETAMKAAFAVFGEKRRLARGEPQNPLELPAAELDRIMDNAGTDAVVVSFAGAFHGRGFGPLTVTHSKVIHKADFPAFPWPMVPFPTNKWPLEQHKDENDALEADCLRALENTLDAFAGRVALVMVEPVQSEGGDRHASADFFRKVQAMTKAAGAAFMLDEVQTGVGITGKRWCHEHFDLPAPPDLMAFGKKMQLGGFFATEPYAIKQFGRMYQTRNGDRARAMLSLAIQRVIDEENLLEHVRDTGAYFLGRLLELARDYPALVTEPRGKGFLLAFDLPTTASRDDFLKRCMKRGIFASYTGVRSVRLRPHLILTRADADEAMTTFHAVAKEMAG